LCPVPWLVCGTVSESGSLLHRDGRHEGGDHRWKVLMLASLVD